MSPLSANPGHSSPGGSPLPAKPLGALALAFLILFIDGCDLFTLGTVGPALLRHGAWGGEITAGTLGMLGSVTGIGMILGSGAAGPAGDRFGLRLPLVTALAVISVSMLLSALAPGLPVFIAARVLTGLGVGALAPLVGAFVTAHAPRRRRTLYIAVAMAALRLGGAVSAYLGRALLPETDFRWMFAPASCLCFSSRSCCGSCRSSSLRRRTCRGARTRPTVPGLCWTRTAAASRCCCGWRPSCPSP